MSDPRSSDPVSPPEPPGWGEETEDRDQPRPRGFLGRVLNRLVSGEYEEEIDTLGGLIFMLAGRVPARGETIVHESGVAFEVVDANARRIIRVRVQRPDSLQHPAPA